jgi:hypothetical protein
MEGKSKKIRKEAWGFNRLPTRTTTATEGHFITEEPTLEGLQRSFRYGLASQGLFSDEGSQFFGGHAMNPDNALKTMSGLSKFWDGTPSDDAESAE